MKFNHAARSYIYLCINKNQGWVKPNIHRKVQEQRERDSTRWIKAFTYYLVWFDFLLQHKSHFYVSMDYKMKWFDLMGWSRTCKESIHSSFTSVAHVEYYITKGALGRAGCVVVVAIYPATDPSLRIENPWRAHCAISTRVVRSYNRIQAAADTYCDSIQIEQQLQLHFTI